MTSEEIKTLRKHLGQTQEQFAQTVGVSLPTVARWELGLFKPLPIFQRKMMDLAKNNHKTAP